MAYGYAYRNTYNNVIDSEQFNMNAMYLRNLHHTMITFKLSRQEQDHEKMLLILEQFLDDLSPKISDEIETAVEKRIRAINELKKKQSYIGEDGSTYIRQNITRAIYTLLCRSYRLLIKEMNRVGLLTRMKENVNFALKT